MSFLSLMLMAVGLAADATAVAVARGVLVRSLRVRDFLFVALAFGVAQALMPLLGASLGHLIGQSLAHYQRFLVCAVFMGVGGKMLFDVFFEKEEDDLDGTDPLAFAVMLALAVATSLDAFAVGVTLPMMQVSVVSSSLIIGIVTALLSALGLYVGQRFGSESGKRFVVVGGLILCGLGMRALWV
jgi:manganese efflux pump family protein